MKQNIEQDKKVCGQTVVEEDVSFLRKSPAPVYKKWGSSRKQKGSYCAVLQLFWDLRAFIYESGEKAGTRQDFILQSRDAKGHNTNIMILWSGLSWI